MNSKKSIIVIVPRVPFPLDAGGKIAIYSAVDALSKEFEVHLVIITDELIKDVHQKSMLEISKTCQIFYFSKLRCRINSLKSIYNKLPLQVNYFYHNEVQEYINNLMPTMDYGYSFMIRTSHYLQSFDKFKVINFIDSLFLSYSRSVSNTSSFIWKMIYNFEIKVLEEYERKSMFDFSSSIFVNFNEANYWSQFAPNVYCLPFGIEQSLLEYEKIDKTYSSSIVFLGKMDYQPNVDAVKWFCQNVLQKLPNSIRFTVIGASPAKEIIELTKKYSNIEVTGFLEDPYAIIRGALTVVAPMQSGGGLQTKVLVSMALGAKVIAPKWVIEPIPGAEVNVNILASESADDYARLIKNIHSFPSDYEHIGINARKTAIEKFSWVHYQSENIKLFKKYI